MSILSKNSWNCIRVARCNSTDFAQRCPAPRTSQYEKHPQAARSIKVAMETRPERRSVVWTSTVAKPVVRNAKAVSARLMTPCSRRMATRGLEVKDKRVVREAENERMFYEGLRVRL